jgi:hypothetical protein
MRTPPNRRDESDVKDILKLNAAKWQIDLLDKNPEYVFWGNYEDYMSDKNAGWRSPVELESFDDVWGLDNLNELVNFYFEITRKSHECPHCEGEGLNPKTKQLSDDWYDFEGTGRRWCNSIGEVEVEALMKGGRLTDFTGNDWYSFDEKRNVWQKLDRNLPMSQREWVDCEKPEFPTPEEVNKWSKSGGLGGHDAINQWICVKARAKHLGIYGSCEHCDEGRIYDEDFARVGLQLWYLLPRKGTSRGVYVKNIEEKDLPRVIEYLKEAAQRNAQRFEKL